MYSQISCSVVLVDRVRIIKNKMIYPLVISVYLTVTSKVSYNVFVIYYKAKIIIQSLTDFVMI